MGLYACLHNPPIYPLHTQPKSPPILMHYAEGRTYQSPPPAENNNKDKPEPNAVFDFLGIPQGKGWAGSIQPNALCLLARPVPALQATSAAPLSGS